MEGYVDREEAAQLAGVHWNTIRLWERTGRVHPKREMRGAKERVLIPLSELQAIIDTRGAKYAPAPNHDQISSLRESIARLEAELGASRERLTELRNERERLLDRLLDTRGGE